MRTTTIVSVLAIASSAVAQLAPNNTIYPGTSCGALIDTFNLCIYNALTDVTSENYPDVTAFCSGKRDTMQDYYKCLYTNSCPNDPNISSVRGSLQSNCAAVITTSTAAPLVTAPATITPGQSTFSSNNGPTLDIPGGSSKTTSAPAGSSSKPSAAGLSVPANVKVAVAGGVVGLLFGALAGAF
ncbi:hypothetical protein HDU97_008123 [Phlyctochytrium planicorne]|nr:hypothetical protein HDU97_008123 [Phlyctochytrium planicorne]